ncbi:hypothetical protein AOQ84DRAFT_360321 [Glonium stellatum]|uniref:GIT Spa2 homology (SHD) domain-containing protein n=1 Tax=Glonium stellatum TaxID=574774 RepID=A0A8E2F921_9PEZI|nr:hypothetical protein AOQ84DRAFT_360321 [Glonium stellatum]
MNGRNGTLSPVSTDSNDWSPITRYQNINGSDNPYSAAAPNNRGVTPPTSVHTSTSTTDGGMLNGMSRRTNSNGNPSPPSSVGRSSDGTGLYASSMTEGSVNSRSALMLEETLSEHYTVLKSYLAPYLRDEKGNPRPSRAKDKLTRLSAVQFQELSTDVYDESIRREQERKLGGPGATGNNTPKYLLAKNTFHPKRNQARQKLSTLPLERFRQLATDVFYELERRFPRFTGAEIERIGSPVGSIASRSSNRGPPSRAGTPNSMNSGPPPGFRGPPPPRGGPPFRNGPPGPGGSGGPGGPGLGVPRPGSQQSQNNEYGRPLPKTFQSNTIIPNKSTMVEDDDDQSGVDDDDDDQEDAFDLEGAARRQSRRQTNKSLKSIRSMNGQGQDKLVVELQTQVTQLQERVDMLEGKLQEKDAEVEALQAAGKDKDSSSSSERAEWDELRYSLERKVSEAQNLNTSLRSELDKLRTDNSAMEQDLRAQISELSDSRQQQSQNSDDGEWRRRYEDLEREFGEQQHVTEEVRREASQFLQEMRALSSRSDHALEKEERLSNQVSSLEAELKEWKSRYARTKTQLRTLRASSMGLAMQSPDASNYTRDAAFATPDGLVKDVHVTKFQLSIDELLQVARKSEPQAVLECMKNVVVCIRNITSDIDAAAPGPLSPAQSMNGSVNDDGAGSSSPEKHQMKLKSRVSATANNLITASKNHASAAGLSPVSLLDAAASHLTTAVVELVKLVKIRPTPADELEREEEEDDRPMPLGAGYSSYGSYGSSGVNGAGHLRHRSRGSVDSAGYGSSTGSPRRLDGSWASRRSEGPGLTNGISEETESGLVEFKNYLDDQTALLVHSIQPLVNIIRAAPTSASLSQADEQAISDYIADISRTVQDTAYKTHEAVNTVGDAALKKHAIPVVELLDECRLNLLEIDVREEAREKVPPLAFRTARAMKELVLRVERIEIGELRVEQTALIEF